MSSPKTFTSRKNLHEIFIENRVLHSLNKWLKPLPDGSLPNIRVRETVLEVLNDFRDVPTEDLKESGMGRSIMTLWKHPSETPQNKKAAKELIERWSRPIFGISERYRDLKMEDSFSSPSVKRTPQRK